jgi:methyl-accepting chemotaxis protein
LLKNDIDTIIFNIIILELRFEYNKEDMKKLNEFNINTKLNTVVLFVVAVILIVNMFFVISRFNSYTVGKTETETNTALAELRERIEQKKSEAANYAKLIALSNELEAAIVKSDREAILQYLNSKISIANLDFITVTNAQGIVIARSHEPQKYGDDVTNQINIREALKGKQVALIEKGTAVKLSARSGAPIKNAKGEIIGVVSTGFALDKNELLDEMKKMVNCDFTIFLGDVRISTTLQQNGKRLVGTKLKPEIAQIVLSEKKSFNGDAEILGMPFVTSYIPLISEGDVLGVLFAGKSMHEIYNVKKEFVLYVSIISVFGFVALALIMFAIIKRILMKPIQQATKMMTELSKGHLQFRIETSAKDEIGVMVQTMNTFSDTLQNFVILMYDVANGKLDVKASEGDSNDELAPALNKIVETLGQLKIETDLLTQAAVDGKTDYRGNTEKYSGGYKTIVEGFNKTINEIITVVRQGEKAIKKMSTGDLTARMVGEFKGNFKSYQECINRLGESLEKVIEDVTEAVHAVASASDQISSSTEEMAAGSQEQSAQASEVAAAVEQMSSTILETTKNTHKASESAADAGITAKEGGRIVLDTVDGMNNIAQAVEKAAVTVRNLGDGSKKIGEIIQVIDDIADQTNLLALNAAIEAARAGEQGRGFAVVADEVRKLAERTTKATKEIASMIKQIQMDTNEAVDSMDKGSDEVSKGKLLAEKAGGALEGIIKKSEAVVDVINQVAAASEEQSSTAEQISKNIVSINNVTQENASGSQQIARAAEDLNKLTETLRNMISQFKTNDNTIKRLHR